MDVVVVIRDHFRNLFTALRIDNGRHFNIDNIPRIQVDGMDRILQLEMWDYALDHRSFHAYHALAILTNEDFLEEALHLAVSKHEFWAIASLSARLSKKGHRVLPLVNCLGRCDDCAYIRDSLLDQLELEHDWAYVRSRLLEARRRNLWIMWQPIMMLSPVSDVVMKRIKSKSAKGLSTLFAAVFFIKLWRSWVQRQMRPESSFVKKVAQRWKK